MKILELKKLLLENLITLLPCKDLHAGIGWGQPYNGIPIRYNGMPV